MINLTFCTLSSLAFVPSTLAALRLLILNLDSSSLLVGRRRASFPPFSCVYQLLTAHLANDTLYLRPRPVRRPFFPRRCSSRIESKQRWGRGQRGRAAIGTQRRPERCCLLDGDRWRLLPGWQRYCGAAKRELASKWSLSCPAG